MNRFLRDTPLLIAAVTAFGTGMALVAGGVRVGSLFMPGVVVLGVGFLLAAGAGVAALARHDEGTADDA